MTPSKSSPVDPRDPTLPPIERLIAIMARLRDPARGCPWDKEQNFASIAPYTIEEAYEVADAIQHGDMTALRDELGDLLLQVVVHAQMAREAGSFDIDDVAEGHWLAHQRGRRGERYILGNANLTMRDPSTSTTWPDPSTTR